MSDYLDIHCHGGGGYAFGSDVDGTLAAAAAHRAHGSARIIASLVSEPIERTTAGLDVLRQAMARDESIIGAHLEGPFIAPARKGAHDPSALRLPTPSAVAELLGAGEGIIRQVTIAPELEGALEAIEQFVQAGVVVAVGHTEANADLAREAFDRGATLLTHGFNTMRGIAAREGGPVGAALADGRVAIELIADGIHVDPSLIATIFRAAPGRVVLVTDAMAAAASAPGRYRLGSLDVDVVDGHAYVAGTTTLAGSTLTMDRAVDVCVAAGVPRAEAVAAASTTPARVISL